MVHFNLLDGSLLVNGKPLGRLPNEIQRHPLYNLIFGEVRLFIRNVIDTQVTDHLCSKCSRSYRVTSQGWTTRHETGFPDTR